MVPTYYSSLENWLERFSNTLDRWEHTLGQLEVAYATSNLESIVQWCQVGETIHREIEACQQERNAILAGAASVGHVSEQLQELSRFSSEHWPANWTREFQKLTLQLQRVQKQSMSLWVSAYQSQTMVAELLNLLSTGNSANATYAATESETMGGGQLINEAA